MESILPFVNANKAEGTKTTRGGFDITIWL